MYWVIAALAAAILLMPKRAIAYIRGVPRDINLAGIGNGQSLRLDAAASFNLMAERAAKDGVKIFPDSGFRTMAEQTQLKQEVLDGKRTTLVAEPGFSNHQGGIAVDIAVQSSQFSTAYIWLARNAKTFGFINTGANFSTPEYWHWEYFGGSNA